MDDDLKIQQQLYDQTWQKGLNAGKEQRSNLQTNLDFLAQIDLLKTDDKILEIGCGIGTVVNELSEKNYDITGIDISQHAIDYGKEKYGDINLQVNAAEILPFEDQSFNVVLSFDLLEHIAKIDKHISEVYRVLKNNGCYLFQTPNKYSNMIFETLTTKSLKWRRAHPSLHSPRQLKKRLNKHGFNTKFVKMNTINQFTIKKLKKIGYLADFIKYINFQKMPLSLQTNLYVIAKKIN